MENSISAADEVIRPIVAIKVKHPTLKRQRLVYAMLDSGSDRDVIAEELITELGLEQRSKMVTVQTVDSTVSTRRCFVDFRVESLDGNYRADVNGALVGKLLTSENDLPPAKRDFSSLKHANGIIFDDINADISMIIGVSHAEAWVGAEIRRGSSGQPIMMSTSFGWTAVGGWSRGDASNIACAAAVDLKPTK